MAVAQNRKSTEAMIGSVGHAYKGLRSAMVVNVVVMAGRGTQTSGATSSLRPVSAIAETGPSR
jgi:hypothetical protein